MKGALVTFIAKVEGVAKEKFSGAQPQTPTSFAPPPIKIPGRATVCVVSVFSGTLSAGSYIPYFFDYKPWLTFFI